jgi:hypothetical protein
MTDSTSDLDAMLQASEPEAAPGAVVAPVDAVVAGDDVATFAVAAAEALADAELALLGVA